MTIHGAEAAGRLAPGSSNSHRPRRGIPAGVAWPGTDVVIERIAAGQHGIVSRDQLIAAGVSRQSIDRRVRSRRLRPLHPGVYQVGPVVARLGHVMAAVLAYGESAAASHFTAAWIRGMWTPDRPPTVVHLLIPGRGYRARAGLRFHRRRAIRPDEVGTVDGVRATTVARTLFDLAALLGLRQLERMLAAAERAGAVTRPAVLTILDRYPRARGAARLRALVDPSATPRLTRSGGEEAVLDLVAAGGLTPPIINGFVLGFEVDFHWPEHRFILELDGYAFHSGRTEFEDDRRRDRLLQAAGWRVMRITGRQLQQERDAILVAIAQALIERATPPSRREVAGENPLARRG
jgi:hypothetical protein